MREARGRSPSTATAARASAAPAASWSTGGRTGRAPRTTSCELRLRAFDDGAEITLEPFRAGAFPVLRDLIVDRSALDRIVQAGGYVSVRTGSAPEANAMPVAKAAAERALDAAACIGCGACVAACPNGSAALFTAAKLAHLAHLPQGQPERARAHARDGRRRRRRRASAPARCTASARPPAPRASALDTITRMQREFLRASVR